MNRIVYRKSNGQIVKGFRFNILNVDDDYHLIDLNVYADGHIDCLGSIEMDKLEELLNSGKLTRSLPENARIFIPFIGYIHSAYSISSIQDNDQFIQIIKQKIGELKRGESDDQICIEKFKEYLLNPSELNLKNLKISWNKLPIDQRALFEVEYKDPLMELMNQEKQWSKEEREYMLKDYFEGEWLEMK
jgi:hypothetical protein